MKIYYDGASIEEIIEFSKNPIISGFTTNPTLLKKAGIKNYTEFAEEVSKKNNGKPISIEVFADDDRGMIEQAKKLASISNDFYIKIPITNTNGVSTSSVVSELSSSGIKLNITAIFTKEQVSHISEYIENGSPAILSIFAGRILDTQRSPHEIVCFASRIARRMLNVEVLWASAREVYHITLARDSGCDIITLSPDLIKKIGLEGKSLKDYSLETVRMFYKDAVDAGYKL